MSKTRDELKAKRARYVVWLEEQTDALRRLRDKFHEDEKISEDIIADYHAELADLDRAIAALTPAPGERDAEVEVPDGFTKWEGVVPDVGDGESVQYFMWDNIENEDGSKSTTRFTPFDPAWQPDAQSSAEIIAYRVLPTQPASSPHAEGYAPVVGEGEQPADTWIEADAFVYPKREARLAARWSDGAVSELHYAGYTDTTHEPRWIAEKRGDATVTHLLIVPEDKPAPDPLSISASGTHAAESDAVKAAVDAIVASIVLPELGPDTVGTQTYMDGDQLVVREVTASEYTGQHEHPDAPFWARVLAPKVEA